MTALVVNIAIYYPCGPLELRWDQPVCSLDQILYYCIEKALLEWQIVKQSKQNQICKTSCIRLVSIAPAPNPEWNQVCRQSLIQAFVHFFGLFSSMKQPRGLLVASTSEMTIGSMLEGAWSQCPLSKDAAFKPGLVFPDICTAMAVNRDTQLASGWVCFSLWQVSVLPGIKTDSKHWSQPSIKEAVTQMRLLCYRLLMAAISQLLQFFF